MTQTFELDTDYNLNELSQTVKKLSVRFDWKIRSQEDDFGTSIKNAADFDLDASVFLLNVLKMIRSEQDFVFYNNKQDADEAVSHVDLGISADQSGEKERIDLNLSKVPYEIQTLVFAVSLHNGRDKRQDLSMVESITIALVDASDDTVLGQINLTGFDAASQGVVCAELNRIGPEWIFRPVNICHENGLSEIASGFDVNIRNI